ncbi:DUF362 domain-containing protein [Candidatus Woesearchaeota archaeon]|nr:DUF362 domain-containing protein [Candidatus Woesearchaeota archaeon]
MKAKVSIVKCESYQQKEVDTAVKKAVDLIGGIDKFVKKGDNVLLKPNLLSANSPDKHVTTHPGVVEAVIKLVKKAGGKVYVGDSPGAKFSTLETAKKCGIYDICKKNKVRLLEFNNPKLVENNKSKVYKKMILEKSILDMDLIINLPKMKTHCLTNITAAVKNLYGCIPEERKMQLHFKYPNNIVFSELLLDLYEYIKPQLNILDGIIGMDGNGPSNGNLKKVGLILASDNALAMDSVMCKVTSISEESVPTLTLAKKRGIFNRDNVEILGENIKSCRVSFKLPQSRSFNLIPGFLKRFLAQDIMSYPHINRSKCVGCSICIKNCPAKTIKLINKKAKINHKKCIRCFCCQELCPHDAIKIKQTLLSKVFKNAFNIYKKFRNYFQNK